jgi:hypothetical protein
VIDNQQIIKILGKLFILRGDLRGRSPPRHKNGYFKAEGLFLGGRAKYKKINNFRIIGQDTY